MKTNMHFLKIISRSVLFSLKMFQAEVVEKIKTHFIFDNVLPKIVSFMR